ncbi:SRPBCC family protein [Spirillospora sp. NPDC050679]
MNTPTGIDTTAPVIARHQLLVQAPADAVWTLLTDVASWPSWQPDITTADLGAPLEPGATFHWSTAGLDIASTVYDLRAPHRILWGGPAHGITGVHQWTLTPTGDGATLVATEESWSGEPVLTATESVQQSLDRSLVQWLAHLKTAAEKPA